MDKKTVVRFVAGCPPYNAGECAGFTVEELAKIPSRLYEIVQDEVDTPVRVEVDKKPKSSKKEKSK